MRENFDDDVASATIEKRGGEWCAVFQLAATTFICLDEFGRYYPRETVEDLWNKKSIWADEFAMKVNHVKTRVETAAYLNQTAKISNRALRELKVKIATERRLPK